MFIPVPGEITPEWLTAVLRQAGVIGPAEVTAVEILATDALNSHTSHLAREHTAPLSQRFAGSRRGNLLVGRPVEGLSNGAYLLGTHAGSGLRWRIEQRLLVAQDAMPCSGIPGMEL